MAFRTLRSQTVRNWRVKVVWDAEGEEYIVELTKGSSVVSGYYTEDWIDAQNTAFELLASAAEFI